LSNYIFDTIHRPNPGCVRAFNNTGSVATDDGKTIRLRWMQTNGELTSWTITNYEYGVITDDEQEPDTSLEELSQIKQTITDPKAIEYLKEQGFSLDQLKDVAFDSEILDAEGAQISIDPF